MGTRRPDIRQLFSGRFPRYRETRHWPDANAVEFLGEHIAQDLIRDPQQGVLGVTRLVLQARQQTPLRRSDGAMYRRREALVNNGRLASNPRGYRLDVAAANLSVVRVFYDAGEEQEARKDALKLLEAGAADVRVAQWPAEAPHGEDINGHLIEDPDGFKRWAVQTIVDATPVGFAPDTGPRRDGEPDTYASPVPDPPPWPALAPEALHGLPGDVVRAVEPHTEADPVAVLTNVLCAFGNAVGRGAHVRVGADRHHLNLCVGLVGETSKGRKGTSWGYPRELMHAADADWADERIQNGLSSGEGLIYAVRDEVVGRATRKAIRSP